MLTIRHAENGEIHLAGRFDAAEAERLGGELLTIRHSVRLDCAELDYISSAGIGILIGLYKRLAAEGHTMSMVNLLPRVRNTFRYAGLEKVLGIE